MTSSSIRGRLSTSAAALLAATLAFGMTAASAAEDKFLEETADFAGAVLFLDSHVPGLVLGVVRNGQTAVFGYGEASDGSGKPPDGNTILRLGSITKVFTGEVFASLVDKGTVQFTDKLQDRIGWKVTVPSMGGHDITLLNLATHSSGLPREAERPQGPADDPFGTLTDQAYIDALNSNPQVFPAGTGVLYSNFAFDVLAAALGNAAGKPYLQVLKETVLDPVGMKDTGTVVPAGSESRVFQGHNFDGKPMPDVTTTAVMAGASSLYSTPNDMLRWLSWHLDRFAATDADLRLTDHAAYVPRDGLDPVSGVDESGHMDAMGLGWIIMQPDGDRPLILQKAGGLQGIFTYTAFSPARGIGVFIAINQFNFSVAGKMTEVANDLIEQLAPR